MRQIKFRAWSKVYEDWIRDYKEDILIFGPINALTNAYNPETLVIQQYSGINDKNGREIFEGDVVKYGWELYEHDVEWTIGEVFFEDGIFLIDRTNEFSTNDSNFLRHTIEYVEKLVHIE